MKQFVKPKFNSMKTYVKISILAVAVMVLFVRAMGTEKHAVQGADKAAVEIPADVKAVIDNKCYMCHSPEGRSADAKADLLWDSIPSYPKAKLIAKLDKIIDVLNDGTMPPAKFVESQPKAAITAEESKLLKAWAEKTADGLLK